MYFNHALRENPHSFRSHNNPLDSDLYCAIAYYNLAFAYGSQGLLEKCRDSLEEALRLDPDMQAARDELKRLKKFENQH